MKTQINYILILLACLFLYGCRATCVDNKKNGKEAGVDCGGKCDDCWDVVMEKELLIRDTNVVNSFAATSGDLSFGKLMERLTPPTTNTKDFILSLLTSWESDHIVNGITVNARPAVSDTLIGLWKDRDGIPRTTPNSNWNMNLTNAPFRLLALTNRLDLNDVSNRSAGEGRLTFGLAHGGDNDFTLIFEYKLFAENKSNIVSWAKRWHKLSDLDMDSPEYLDTLTNIVLAFSASPNSLNQIRTNEVIGGIADRSFKWELREFNIIGNQFEEVSRKQSPDQNLNDTPLLASYITQHQQDILSGQHEIEATFTHNNSASNFLAGNTLYDSNFKWKAPGFDINAIESRRLTAMSCTGCHGGLVGNTEFTHIKPRVFDEQANISLFLSMDLLSRRDSIGEILEQRLPTVSQLPSTLLFRDSSLITDITNFLEDIKGVKRVH